MFFFSDSQGSLFRKIRSNRKQRRLRRYKNEKNKINLLLLIGCLTCASCSAAEELTVDYEPLFPGVERVDLLSNDEKLRLMISKRGRSEIVATGRDVKPEYIKLMMFQPDAGKLKPLEKPYGEMYGFDTWSPLSKPGSGCYIIATDISGMNPLDRPDNALVRTWFFDLK